MHPVPLLTAIQSLEERIREVLEGNETLKDIAQRIERRTREVEDADKGLRRSIIDKERVEDAIKEHEEQLKRGEADGPGPLGEEQEARPAERFGEAGALSLGNLEAVMRRVERGITQEAGEVNRVMNNCERFIEKRFDEFVRLWPAEADGLDAALAAAPDFFAKLNRLEVDGLPAHERRFFELLQTQSDQNLAALSTYLRDARKEILERMDLVNASLAEVPFNRSMDRATFLRIDPGDRRLPEVREFKGEIKKALSHAWSPDPELAESRFTALRDLVERLSGGKAESDDGADIEPAGAGDRWPLEVNLDIPTENQALRQVEDVRCWVESWQSWRGGGSISWADRRWSRLGTQRLPGRLTIGTPLEAARWIGEGERWERAAGRFAQLAGRWPGVRAVLPRYFGLLADYSEGEYRRLIAMAEWLKGHPLSNLYPRQLPVPGVDSKWLESRKRVLADLVGGLSGGAPGGGDFFERCGLKALPRLVRLRILGGGGRSRSSGRACVYR